MPECDSEQVPTRDHSTETRNIVQRQRKRGTATGERSIHTGGPITQTGIEHNNRGAEHNNREAEHKDRGTYRKDRGAERKDGGAEHRYRRGAGGTNTGESIIQTQGIIQQRQWSGEQMQQIRAHVQGNITQRSKR